jgi:hypothetical protein
MAHRRSQSGPGRRAPDRALATRSQPSPTELLGRFSDALSLLAVAHGSLSAKELRGTGDEEVAIRHAIEALKGIYSELDRASISMAHAWASA